VVVCFCFFCRFFLLVVFLFWLFGVVSFFVGFMSPLDFLAYPYCFSVTFLVTVFGLLVKLQTGV
jgi:hypothetical protein